ncbi:MAG: MarR family winged helix-turn-helix transcriptional regulator [Streptosporangiaceae bacterium]|jgi:DNA-binding MarR family transcriptional regulator
MAATGARTEAEAAQQLLPLLDHLARVGRRAAEASMAPGGLRPRHLVALNLLSEHGAASQQGLVEALSLDPSNVVGLLNELEERGLITRRRDPADRRRHIVELSAGGQNELCLAQARLSRVEDDLLGALSRDERATLYRLLARAVDAVGGAGGKPSACSEADPPSAC